MTPLSYEKDMKEMTKKQYEAFRMECRRRDGHSFDIKWTQVYAGIQSVVGRQHVCEYNDHDSLQKIIDGLEFNDMIKYDKELWEIAGFGRREQLHKATVEQKRAALSAVFGLEGK